MFGMGAQGLFSHLLIPLIDIVIVMTVSISGLKKLHRIAVVRVKEGVCFWDCFCYRMSHGYVTQSVCLCSVIGSTYFILFLYNNHGSKHQRNILVFCSVMSLDTDFLP